MIKIPIPTSILLFQSTHPHGVRRDTGVIPRAVFFLFQSTHPHGVRHDHVFRVLRDVYSFNPRTRMGCDCMLSVNSIMKPVSIHAPAWGATLNGQLDLQFRTVSIHAPAWGATRVWITCTPAAWFQSTHPHGVRLPVFRPGMNVNPVSIHAPAWGATIHKLANMSPPPVSIHAPAWGAT